MYSSFFLRALDEIVRDSRIDIFLKHEKLAGVSSAEKLLAGNNHVKWHTTGDWPDDIRTVAFALKLVVAGMVKRPELVIALLLNFIPAAEVLSRLRAVPYWAVAHGYEAWNVSNPRMRRALDRASLVIAVSGVTRDRLLSGSDIKPERVVILPNTFDENRFRIASKPEALLRRFQLRAETPTMLTVGRIDSVDKYKGHDRVIQAMARLSSSVPELTYLIVGEGDDIARLRGLAEDQGVAQRVIFAGGVSDADLPGYYNICDLFIMPSTSEGFGIVYLEALASGKPVIAGNRDGAVDALCDGRLGTLVDPLSVDEITRAIEGQILRSNSSARERTPNWLREQVISEFGYARFCARLREILERHA